MMLKRGAWVGSVAFVLGLLGCGSTTFSVADESTPDAADASGNDAESGTGTKPDAGGKPDSGSHDGSASDSADAPGASDATSPLETGTHVDGTANEASVGDAKVPTDTSVPPAETGPTCGRSPADDNTGVFVVPSTSASAAGCGQRSLPCADLPTAMANATGSFNKIYVASTQTGGASATIVLTTPLAIKDGISIIGGWKVSTTGDTWTASCDAADTPTIDGVGTSVFTIGTVASPSTGVVVLDTLNIANISQTFSGSAASFYGVSAIGTTAAALSLTNVTIKVPAAGSGAAGIAGNAGGAGAPTGCELVVAGAAGTTPNAVGGTWSAAGYSPESPNSVEATTGGSGSTEAPADTCANSITSCTLKISNGQCTAADTSVCSGYTMNGCGGAGGSGGYSGGGGGSSVALFLWGEAAKIKDGSLTAGTGGAGGNGGAGGAGGAGATAGSVGSSGSRDTTCAKNNLAVCAAGGAAPIDAPAVVAGGVGASGGQGPGGAGGDSYAYYLGGGATAMVSASTVLTPSAAGAGGTGGAPNGDNGYAGRTNTQD